MARRLADWDRDVLLAASKSPPGGPQAPSTTSRKMFAVTRRGSGAGPLRMDIRRTATATPCPLRCGADADVGDARPVYQRASPGLWRTHAGKSWPNWPRKKNDRRDRRTAHRRGTRGQWRRPHILVPGESYLAVLDHSHDSKIRNSGLPARKAERRDGPFARGG